MTHAISWLRAIRSLAPGAMPDRFYTGGTRSSFVASTTCFNTLGRRNAQIHPRAAASLRDSPMDNPVSSVQQDILAARRRGPWAAGAGRRPILTTWKLRGRHRADLPVLPLSLSVSPTLPKNQDRKLGSKARFGLPILISLSFSARSRA